MIKILIIKFHRTSILNQKSLITSFKKIEFDPLLYLTSEINRLNSIITITDLKFKN
jgi:hypothetical protein